MTFIIRATRDAEMSVDIPGSAFTALILAQEKQNAGYDVEIETLDRRRFRANEFVRVLVNGSI